MTEDIQEEQLSLLREYLNTLSDSGFDVVDIDDLYKKYPTFDCHSLAKQLGYHVEEGMLFL